MLRWAQSKELPWWKPWVAQTPSCAPCHFSIRPHKHRRRHVQIFHIQMPGQSLILWNRRGWWVIRGYAKTWKVWKSIYSTLKVTLYPWHPELLRESSVSKQLSLAVLCCAQSLSSAQSPSYLAPSGQICTPLPCLNTCIPCRRVWKRGRERPGWSKACKVCCTAAQHHTCYFLSTHQCKWHHFRRCASPGLAKSKQDEQRIHGCTDGMLQNLPTQSIHIYPMFGRRFLISFVSQSVESGHHICVLSQIYQLKLCHLSALCFQPGPLVHQIQRRNLSSSLIEPFHLALSPTCRLQSISISTY